MKNIYKFCFLFICCILFASCSEEKKEWDEGIAPGPVTAVTTEADNGTVILKWKNPEDLSFYYVNISYTDTKGVERGRNISKFAVDPNTGYSSDTIRGFGDTNEYKFSLTAHSVGGASSSAVVVAEAPLTPTFNVLIDNIEIEPDFAGVRVKWENETNKSADIVVQWVIKGRVERKTFTASETGFGVIEGIPFESTDFKVYATDEFENQSATKEYTITPYEESEFKKSEWSVPGYRDDSTDGTIGYSSQASNEGSSPKGRVAALFDDAFNKDSFWSSSWNPQKQYPHWFIIDLGKESVISRVELVRRYDDSRMQKGHQFFTCEGSGATDPNDSEVWSWVDQGIFDFNPNTNDRQNYRLLNNPKARYLKVYFPVEKKGSSNDAMLGEMWIYGSQN